MKELNEEGAPSGSGAAAAQTAAATKAPEVAATPRAMSSVQGSDDDAVLVEAVPSVDTPATGGGGGGKKKKGKGKK